MVLKFESELKGERIVLKRIEPTIELAQEVFAQVDKNREYLRKWLPWADFMKSAEDELKYFFDEEKKVEKGEKINYGIFLDNVYAGNIGFFDVDDKVMSGEIGYWLSEDFGRKGYVTEAVKTLEKHLFQDLGFNRIQIKCDEKNIPSAKVAEKCGYVLEGILRQDERSEYFNENRNTKLFSKLKSEFNE